MAHKTYIPHVIYVTHITYITYIIYVTHTIKLICKHKQKLIKYFQITFPIYNKDK